MVEKLEEFAKDGDKNLDGLNVSDGFPRAEKPERPWFNMLFNKLTIAINNLIDYTKDLEDDLKKPRLDTEVVALTNNGGESRTQADKNAEVVSVTDFLANPAKDDNTSEINDTYAYALSVGAVVYFPHGEFKALGGIPNLHKVQARGNGVIVRSDSKFYIEPNDTQQNIIYFKPASLATGDGITKDLAVPISEMPNVMRNLQNRAGLGAYRFIMCAADYTGEKGVRFTDVPSFNKKLEIFGELDFIGNHATIWDGTLSTEPFAFRFDLRSVGLRLHFKDIKFPNWNAEAGNAGAILGWGKHELITENIWVKDSQIGIWTARNCVHRSWGDTLENCSTWGICCQYSSSVIVGLPDKRTKVINCGRGVLIGRASIGHNDYADYTDNTIDNYVTQNSRMTHIDTTFKRWKQVSQYIQNLGLMEGLDNAKFDAASITDATPVLLTENSGTVSVAAGSGNTYLHQPFVPASPYTVNNNTALVQLNIAAGFGSWTRFPKWMLYQGSKLDIKMTARIQGTNTNANSYYSLCADGSDKEILRIKLPAGSYDGVIEAHVEFRDNGGIYAYATLTSTAGVTFHSKTTVTSTHDTFRDKTANNTGWRSYLKLDTTTDNFTYISQKTWVTV